MTDQQTRTGRDLGGLFIVLEGGDGAGKTTQSRLLDQWLTSQRISHLMTREPGGSGLGQRIRELVLFPDSAEICPRAEALLYNADKAQHVEQVIMPALREGKVVVCDRYIDSTIAYQGAGRVLDPEEVADTHPERYLVLNARKRREEIRDAVSKQVSELLDR